MRHIELEVWSERADPIVVSSEIGPCTQGEDNIFIGVKQYQKPGEMKYVWLLEALDGSEALQLMDALSFIVDHQEPHTMIAG